MAALRLPKFPPWWKSALVAAKPSVRDVHVYLGLLLAVVGGSMVSLPWTLVAAGAVLMWIGLFWRGPRVPKADADRENR